MTRSEEVFNILYPNKYDGQDLGVRLPSLRLVMSLAGAAFMTYYWLQGGPGASENLDWVFRLYMMFAIMPISFAFCVIAVRALNPRGRGERIWATWTGFLTAFGMLSINMNLVADHPLNGTTFNIMAIATVFWVIAACLPYPEAKFKSNLVSNNVRVVCKGLLTLAYWTLVLPDLVNINWGPTAPTALAVLLCVIPFVYLTLRLGLVLFPAGSGTHGFHILMGIGAFVSWLALSSSVQMSSISFFASFVILMLFAISSMAKWAES